MKKTLVLLSLSLIGFSGFSLFQKEKIIDFVTYQINPNKQMVCFYWKDENNANFSSIENLKKWLSTKNKELLFATNGGMYKKDFSPQGLYIENYQLKTPLDTTNGKGNFYLKPNGVFYISNEKAFITTTKNFNYSKEIQYATQSGPMLVIDNQIHSAFTKGSKNLNIRNGVGILENGEIFFAMSKKEINLYDFASYFKQLGCKNALYLDGFVSRTYYPKENWIQTDGNFGVIIGVTKNK
ncbi:conserved exported hypothetical protein [Flavobacterium sp. 9AF]|uniref:phosphodiester glycosidase family protein n=1 Tax=Flavobacterium sp. 9AF TaxID=2653142 RepID=UPI0012EFF69A|nr:phosphodiester glycosidase family protein [Flavobacterium sp. 9AF]VXB11490.1 conserved exported hypothetical protein [Flavobacterium sp. 9AF]